MEKPKQLEKVDLQRLRDICQEYIDFVDDDKEYHEDHDYEAYIFEAAVTAIFGREVWEFINNRHE